MTVGSKVKQTLASLKGVEGSLRIYSIQTQDDDTKAVYEEAIKVTGEVIENLENRIKTLEYEEPQYKDY